jgi:uncharacterized coiled-coil protein SlyX
LAYGPKESFRSLVFRSTNSALLRPKIRAKLESLAKLDGLKLEKAIEKFIVEYGAGLLPDRSFKRHWEHSKSFTERSERFESEITIPAPDGGKGDFPLPGPGGVDPPESIGWPPLEDVFAAWLEQARNTHPRVIETAVEFDLCDYPNPKIVGIVKTACKYLAYIVSCRNFIGYRNEDISIYTYRELLSKSRHYLQLALVLEKDYLSYRGQFEEEQKARIKALQSVLRDQAQIALGELQIDEAQELAKLADLQRDKAGQVRNTFRDDMWYQWGGTGMTTKFWNMGSSAAAKGQSMGGGNPYAAAIIAVIDFGIQYANLPHEYDMMAAQLETLNLDVQIADQNIELAEMGIAIANAQQFVNRIDAQMDSMYLQLLYTEALGSEAYRYMYQRAKQLYKTYVDMAIRFSWLAERQLEFLRGVEINTIRFDYYHTRQQSQDEGLLLAAEALQKDIEELNYQRELSEQNRIRAIKTFSLRNEYPTIFANFLNTGEIRFRTTADYLILKGIDTDGDGVVDSLEYEGHSNYPDHFGYLQQRIDSIELRLIGLIGRDQDIRLTLSNLGTSIAMIEDKGARLGDPRFVPAILRRPFQSITFSRAFDESTANTYVFNAPEGILKPFETIGLDTSWELGLNKASNWLEFQNIFDVQLIITYTAHYSAAYEAEQKQKLPAVLRRTRIFSFKDTDFAAAFYQLHNPPCPFPGFRDLRIITFETGAEMFGPNEKKQAIETLYLYVHSQDKLPKMEWKVGVDKLNAGSFMYVPVAPQFENTVENPPNSGTFEDIKGLLDYSKEADGTPRHIAMLIAFNQDVNRWWSIKIVPERNPNEFFDRDVANVSLNTRGLPFDTTSSEVLHAKGGSSSGKRIAIKVPSNILPVWDNYSVQVKFRLVRGGFSINWRMYANKGLYLTIRKGAGTSATLQVGSFDGSTRTPAVATIWPNPLRFDLDVLDWYLLECVSHINDEDPGKTFVRILLDKHMVWEGEISLSTGENYGGLRIAIPANSEAFFDDLLVLRVNRRAVPIETLFVDTFDGSKRSEWAGLDDNTLAPSYMVLEPDDNPAMDLSALENLILTLEYKFETS